MSDKATTIRVKPYTKELILKHSRKQKITQNDLVEKAILVAEQSNFSTEIPLKQIEKMQVQQTNRIIGFLKIQDKNLHQAEENIYHYFRQNLRDDRRGILEYFYTKTFDEFEQISREFYKGNDEVKERFMIRFKDFFSETYKRLLSDIDKID
jgi:hypothetical protein